MSSPHPLNFQRLTRFHVPEPTTSLQEETAAGGTLAKEAEKVHQKALRKRGSPLTSRLFFSII